VRRGDAHHGPRRFAGGAGAQQPSTFRTATDIVEVDVIVRDKAGQFVSDLAMDDFELQDEGRPQQVQQLYLRVAASNGWSREPAANARPRSSDLFLIVFDDAHMTVAGFKRTQAAALTLFSKQCDRGTSAASPAESTSYFNLGKAMELRDFRTRRYYRPTQKWIANEDDRAAAVANYSRYLAIGGPYALQAREGLTHLNWVP